MDKEAYGRSILLSILFLLIMVMLISFAGKINIEKEMSVIPVTNNHNHEKISNKQIANLDSILRIKETILEKKHTLTSKENSIQVVPGGQSIGVLLQSKGVMVVGISPIKDNWGKKKNPEAEAGIQVGDIILKINHISVNHDEKIKEIVEQNHTKKISLEVKRNQKMMIIKMKPMYCYEAKEYRLGIFVRDGAAGVGTLSFYHPQTKRYGALGHIITDIDTAQKIEVSNGKIVGANIQSIQPGQRGKPGEKIGVFDNADTIVGSITDNTNYGVFGTLKKIPTNAYYTNPIPVASRQQIQKGPAEILTVLENNKIEKFSIEIQRIAVSGNGRDLVIKVTDPRLLKITGGIVQGMSGSPIIQQGLFVGAVTHVFIHDPTQGYGILGEHMLENAGITNQVEKKDQAYAA